METLRACHPSIQGLLDLEQIYPHLNQRKLLTDTEREDLQSFVYSRNQKIARLVEVLPRKGSDALQRFIECLQSSTDGTAHGELADKLYSEAEEVLKRKDRSGMSTICNMVERIFHRVYRAWSKACRNLYKNTL